MTNPFELLDARLSRIENYLAVMVDVVPSTSIKPIDPEDRYVYGLAGLAKLLNCSMPTAQRIKDSGTIPYSQVGRKLVFNTEDVLKALGRSYQPKRKIRA